MPIFAVAAVLALGAAPPSHARVLVLELEAVGVDASLARSIDPLVLNAAGGDDVEVLAQSEIKTIATVEAQKAELGCDSSACLAELAGAMGAQFVLFGSVSKLGSTTTVALSIYDSSTSGVVRDSLAVDDVGALPKQLPPKVKALVSRARQLRAGPSASTAAATSTPAPLTPTPPDLDPPGPLYYAGLAGVLLGGTGVVAGGLLAALNEAVIDDPSALAGTKRTAQGTGLVGLIVAAAGVALTGAGSIALVLE